MNFVVIFPAFIGSNFPVSAALGFWRCCCLLHHISHFTFIFCVVWFSGQPWQLCSKTFPWKPIWQFTCVYTHAIESTVIMCGDKKSFILWKDHFRSLDHLHFTFLYILKKSTLSPLFSWNLTAGVSNSCLEILKNPFHKWNLSTSPETLTIV